ncbi:hypothetical protein [Thalassococcus lentus]|uniref:Uncharacterized protein n=1 Tax=Thalassococcus lentus TaxID=1210524 RepID=A0ABT4XSA8_9RHOB|nr:hypothetical protein [Thalassococcus lentus]MDA7424851.1 hypothetical protein [Thalassococcus lentus]
MKRILLSASLICAASFVSAQSEIIIPDDSTRFIQQQPQGDTTLRMRSVTVEGQSQLRGLFGDAWTAGEVKVRAAQTCGSAGMKLIYFKPGAKDGKGRTNFAAVCQ